MVNKRINEVLTELMDMLNQERGSISRDESVKISQLCLEASGYVFEELKSSYKRKLYSRTYIDPNDVASVALSQTVDFLIGQSVGKAPKGFSFNFQPGLDGEEYFLKFIRQVAYRHRVIRKVHNDNKSAPESCEFDESKASGDIDSSEEQIRYEFQRKIDKLEPTEKFVFNLKIIQNTNLINKSKILSLVKDSGIDCPIRIKVIKNQASRFSKEVQGLNKIPNDKIAYLINLSTETVRKMIIKIERDFRD